MSNAPPVLEADRLVKTFSDVGRNVEVLRGVELSVAKGDRIAIIGSSGSGKTTLLQIIGGLDRPTSGEVRVVGESMSTLRDSERGRLRNRALGFVYQFHHLLPEFTALENVAMPLLVRGTATDEAAAEARALWASANVWIIARASFPAANGNAQPWRVRS
jgi:lipoprotein-releasing system ATP-binding protein